MGDHRRHHRGAEVFWGLSGIIMWWQMKPLRNNGMLTMILGILLAGMLG